MSDKEYLGQPPSQLQPKCPPEVLPGCGLGMVGWPLATAASVVAAAAASIVHDLAKNGYTATYKKDSTPGKLIEDFTIKPTKSGDPLGDPLGDMRAAWAHAVATVPKTDGHKDLGLTMISCKIDE